MRNCLLTGNSGIWGSAIRVDDAATTAQGGNRLVLENCTIADNDYRAVYFRNRFEYFHAYNTIFHGNDGLDLFLISQEDDPSTIDFRHNAYETTISTSEPRRGS